MQSEYLKALLLENRDVGERYLMKLKLVNNVDPFTLSIHDLDSSIHGIPPVTTVDIVAYLVLTHSFYTKEQFKAYKSLQAYKYFESGFIVNAGTTVVNDFHILVGKVKHSQRGNAKPLDVWCIVAKDGSVSTAHCTCMAGNSEACSHVGAILFAADHANKRKEAMSCTDVLSTWVMPSTSQVPLVPVSEMDWNKSKPSPQVPKGKEVALTLDVNGLLQKMKAIGYDAAIMRVVEPFATDISKQIGNIIPSMLNIFDERHTSKSHMELVKLSKTINLSISVDQFNMIEKKTRNQAQNQNWYVQRAGRITASKFKAVCRTNKAKPSLSLIKSICYPAKNLFNNKPILWGITHEDVAVEEYTKKMKENHDSFECNRVGFLISKKCPQFGASPDRLVFCECCLGGCLEVKCPYLLSTDNIVDINAYAALKGSCLVEKNGQVVLSKSHTYYYQVMMQLFVSKLYYCDFVIWSPNIFFKQRILPDNEFWEKESETAKKFHSEIIMPELLGKYFTRKEGAAEINYWCICHGIDDGRPMVKCDEEDCETGWFHFECVGLTDTPNIVWYCPKCVSDQQSQLLT